MKAVSVGHPQWFVISFAVNSGDRLNTTFYTTSVVHVRLNCVPLFSPYYTTGIIRKGLETGRFNRFQQCSRK